MPCSLIGLGRALVLFRSEVGVSALVDTCPQRFAPFSRSSCADGVGTCGYHELAFEGTGACVRNRYGPLNRQMRVRTYPTIERHLALWSWFGDLTSSHPYLIAGFSFHVVIRTTMSNGMLYGQVNYRL